MLFRTKPDFPTPFPNCPMSVVPPETVSKAGVVGLASKIMVAPVPTMLIPVPAVFPCTTLSSKAMMLTLPAVRWISMPLPVDVTVLSWRLTVKVPLPPAFTSIPLPPAARMMLLASSKPPLFAAVVVTLTAFVLPATFKPKICTLLLSGTETPKPLVLSISGWLPAARRIVGFGPPLTLTGTVNATPSPNKRCPSLSVIPVFCPVVVPLPWNT